MFDVSFVELLMIGVVSLVVIGPDKLPGAIRTGGLWIGRIKRTIGETRREIEKQLGADEIRRELQNEQVMRNLEKMRDVHQELKQKIQRLESGELLLEDDTDKPAATTLDAQAETEAQPEPSSDASNAAEPHEPSAPPPTDSPPESKP